MLEPVGENSVAVEGLIAILVHNPYLEILFRQLFPSESSSHRELLISCPIYEPWRKASQNVNFLMPAFLPSKLFCISRSLSSRKASERKKERVRRGRKKGWRVKSKEWERKREKERETGRQIANKQRCVPKFNLGYYIRLKIYSLCHIIDFWTAKAKVEFWNTPQTDIWRNRQFPPCMDFRRESFFHVFNTFARLK